jgi:glycosyl transferase, family 25
MKILLINLAKAPDRLAFQVAQFTRLGLKFERVEAVSGDEVDSAYYKKMAASGLRLMSKNEVGCFLSHLECWKKCVALNEPVLILEDDAVVSDHLEKIIDNITLDEGDILNLEMFSSKKKLGKAIYKVNDQYGIYQLIYAGAGAGGYIITPSAAQLCIDKSHDQIGLADLFLYSVKNTRLLQLIPASVMQLCFFEPSDTINTAAKTLIHTQSSKRPSSLESLLANPMTRVRRIKSWVETRYKRYIKSTPNSHITVIPSPSLYHSFEQTKKLLNG